MTPKRVATLIGIIAVLLVAWFLLSPPRFWLNMTKAVEPTAADYAPEASSRWEAMLLGYQRMAPADLFVWHPVILTTPVAEIVSRAGHRAICDRCGEEILNEREVMIGEATLCWHCAHGGYYHLCEDAANYVMPVMQFALHAVR